MELTLNTLRSTKANVILGITRIALGVMFFSTGIMKYSVPMLWEAWSGQLTQSNIPFYTLNLYVIPTIEMTIGVFVQRQLKFFSTTIIIPVFL